MTTSTSIGAASSSVSRSTGCRCRTPDSRRAGDGCRASCSLMRGLPLDLLPGRRPVAVVLALDVRAAVEALTDRCRPVPDLVEVRLVVGVEGLAVLRVGRLRARLGV